MAQLITKIGGERFNARAAQLTNALRGYFTFELGPRTQDPRTAFELIASPVDLLMVDDFGRTLAVAGITRSAHEMIVGHSRTGLADVAVRSRRFKSSSPEALLAECVDNYHPRLEVECTCDGSQPKAIEQQDQTDFELWTQAIPNALIFDTGKKLRIAARAEPAYTVTPADLPDGRGDWEVQDVALAAQSAAAHSLDPGEAFNAVVANAEVPAAHPELTAYLEAVSRFRGMIPSAVRLTGGRSSEAVRDRIVQAQRIQMAHALVYRFNTSNISISVGMKLEGLTRGPLIAVSTAARFIDGELTQQVEAVPETLAVDWGRNAAPAAEALVLARVVEGTDPLGFGRVPIVFAHQPEHQTWARAAAWHALGDFQTASVYSPGEEVIVGYLHNNPGDPVVLGSVFHGKHPPLKTQPQELCIRCGKLTVRFSPQGLDVLLGDSRFAITAEGIVFKGKQVTAKTKAHNWELK